MTLFQAVVLGIVQGLTEFIPVSSSAHLVLVPWALGWEFEPAPAFIFNVLVQLGTLVGVIVYFRRDLAVLIRAALRGLVSGRPLADADSRLAWLIALATVPAAAAGILIKGAVERAFDSPAAVCGFLIGTAALLWGAERVGRRERSLSSLSPLDATWVGIGQAFALFPGISRSGATIAAGLTRHLQRPEAARLSFLMSVPAMLGAGAVALLDLAGMPATASFLPPLALGFVSAAVVGFFSIRWFLGYLARRSLAPFALYCLLVGAAGLVLNLYA
jgi:undecaprenyl-diphosphatase